MKMSFYVLSHGCAAVSTDTAGRLLERFVKLRHRELSNEVLDSGKVSTCPKLSALDSLMWIALFLCVLFGFTLSANAQFKDFPQIPSLSGGFTGDYWNRNYHLTAVYPYHTDNFTGWIGLHSRAHRTDASENIEGYLLSEYARLRVEFGYKLRPGTHIGLYSEGSGYNIVGEERNDTIGLYLRPFVRRNTDRRFVLTSKLGLAMHEAHTEPMWHPLPTLNVTARWRILYFDYGLAAHIEENSRSWTHTFEPHLTLPVTRRFRFNLYARLHRANGNWKSSHSAGVVQLRFR